MNRVRTASVLILFGAWLFFALPFVAVGPNDVIFNPSGRAHYFRNDGVTDAEFMLLVGTPKAEDVRFQAA